MSGYQLYKSNLAFQASVSIGRINKFLQTGDLDSSNVSHDNSSDNPIQIKMGTFAWGTSEDDLLTLRG